jgi:hypothetical protein
MVAVHVEYRQPPERIGGPCYDANRISIDVSSKKDDIRLRDT